MGHRESRPVFYDFRALVRLFRFVTHCTETYKDEENYYYSLRDRERQKEKYIEIEQKERMRETELHLTSEILNPRHTPNPT